jgi:hypothetical protein
VASQAQLDEITEVPDEHAGGVAQIGVRDGAATGRVARLRALLGRQRSSEGLIDEDQALANCKPLSRAVLSITRQEHKRVMSGSRPSAMPSSRVGDSAASNSESSGGDALSAATAKANWS